MHKRIGATLGVGTLAVAGFMAAVFAVPVIAGSNRPAAVERTAAVTVRVTATEFKFKLSTTKVPLGKVTFVVTNRGKLPHDFRIAGKKTKLLKSGASQSIVVTFKKSGRYAYVCTVTGHAAAGMKGVLAVGTASAPPPTPTTTTTTPAPTTTTTATPPPGAIQIQVLMNEFSFKLSQTSVPVGSTVFFTVVNQGQVGHDLVFASLGARTPVIQPGQTGTLTVTFPAAGKVHFDCDLPQHAEAGMFGDLTVTG